MSRQITKYEQMILDYTDEPLNRKTADAIADVVAIEEKNEWASDLANDLYFLVMDHVDRDKFIEPDPDSEVGGTRNTPKGRELYYNIEGFLEEFWVKERIE